MNNEIMWLDAMDTLYVDNDLNDFLLENSFDTDATLTIQTFYGVGNSNIFRTPRTLVI